MTASFSLLSSLDLDLDPLERTPSPEPTSYPIYRPSAPLLPAPSNGRGFVPPAALGGHNRAWIGTGPLTPFFAFPSGKLESPVDGSLLVENLPSGVGLERAESAAGESRKRLGEAAGAFWRSESA